jgi:hypothetical protein
MLITDINQSIYLIRLSILCHLLYTLIIVKISKLQTLSALYATPIILFTNRAFMLWSRFKTLIAWVYSLMLSMVLNSRK